MMIKPQVLINFIGFCFLLFLCGFFNNHANYLYRLGLYTGLPLTITLSYYFQHHSLPQISLGQSRIWQATLFALSSFLIIFLVFSLYFYFNDIKMPLQSFINEMKKPLLFFLFCIIASQFNSIVARWIVMAFILIIMIALAKGFLLLTLHAGPYVVSDSFSIRHYYVPILTLSLPFLYALFFKTSSAWIKACLVALCFMSFFLIIYSGSRGAWLSCLVSLFLTCSMYAWRVNKKAIILWMLLSGTLFMVFVYVLSLHNPIVEQKIHTIIKSKEQSLDRFSSGRVSIITERFPLIYKYGSFIGLGYGGWSNEQYLSFMRKHHAPEHIGDWRQSAGSYQKSNEFFYYNDEPFILSVYYQGGSLALIAFIAILFLTPALAVTELKKVDYLKQPWLFCCLLGILNAFIAYTISGFFEFRAYSYYVVFVILTLFLSYRHESKAGK